jgi:hypothetical protein
VKGGLLYIALLTVAIGVDKGHCHTVTEKELPGCDTIIENQSHAKISSPHFEPEQNKVKREWSAIHSSFGGYRWVEILYWLLATELNEVTPKDDHQLYPRKERPDV